MALIEFRGATKRYGGTTAVDSLELSIEEGTLVALIGPSGSGKTTSLRMINRLVEPDDGDVYYAGRKVKEYRPEVLRRGMGYVIQSVGLFPHLTVADNIATVPRLLGQPGRGIQRRVDELLALVGLDPAAYRGRFPRELSGGEAQRVGVARALAADPPVLLMDEPFGAVDPLQRTKLQDEFLRIQREIRKTVVLVTHDLDEAIRLADLVVLMRDGRIAQAASPAVLLAEPANDFVREFTGADRSLKRLARIQVSAVARPAPSVPVASLLRCRRLLRWPGLLLGHRRSRQACGQGRAVLQGQGFCPAARCGPGQRQPQGHTVHHAGGWQPGTAGGERRGPFERRSGHSRHNLGPRT
jgi:osmoprotectant transport system ATP-binding protein